jgi:GT2 family glycosyltransferase
MTDLPLIAIVLVTYRRTQHAVRTVRSTIENLKYPKDLLCWVVGDDGSPKAHEKAVKNALTGQKLIGYYNERLRNQGEEKTFFAGQTWNQAMGIGYQQSDFVLFLEDDWELEQPLDLAPYARMLQEREDVGICTFRILNIGADVHTVGHDGVVYLQYQRTTPYAYCGHPALRHARFVRRYGWFHEQRSPGEIELDMDARYRGDPEGPHVWRPAALDPWGGYHHIGQEKTWI